MANIRTSFVYLFIAFLLGMTENGYRIGFHNLSVKLSDLAPISQPKAPSESLSNILQPDQYYEVTKIVDGDTFYAINNKGEKKKYRLIGMDTPEYSHFGRPEEPFAQEATDYLTKLIGDQPVRLVYDVQRLDRYNRDLVYVFKPDGTFINAELVKAGWAVVATFPPNVAHVEHFVKMQREAREKGRGVWQEMVTSDRRQKK